MLKKTAFAFLALNSVLPAAFAQSSVTLYGIVDAGLGYTSGQRVAQSSGADGMTDLSFTVSRDTLERAVDIAREVGRRVGAERVDPADDLAKVSIVGTGMQSAPGYAARMFGALASAGVNIAIISTSDIRITCVVPRDRAEDAVRVQHTTFELDRKD